MIMLVHLWRLPETGNKSRVQRPRGASAGAKRIQWTYMAAATSTWLQPRQGVVPYQVFAEAQNLDLSEKSIDIFFQDSLAYGCTQPSHENVDIRAILRVLSCPPLRTNVAHTTMALLVTIPAGERDQTFGLDPPPPPLRSPIPGASVSLGLCGPAAAHGNGPR